MDQGISKSGDARGELVLHVGLRPRPWLTIDAHAGGLVWLTDAAGGGADSRAQAFAILKRDPHATPVLDVLTYYVDLMCWFLDGNPIVGYSRLKTCVRLLFWSGQSFDEPDLADEGSFKAAEARYTEADQIDEVALARWLAKARDIQWDYANLVKRKGRLERLK